MEDMRNDAKKERRGAGIPLGAGSGGGSAAGKGAMSAVVGASRVPSSPLSFVLDAVGRATGLSSVLATKAGVVALMAVGLTAAAGITFIAHKASPPSLVARNPFPSGSSSQEDAYDPGTSARAADPAGGVSNSLEYFRQANPPAEQAASNDAAASGAAAAAEPSAAADNSNSPANAGPADRPRMVAGAPGASTRGGASGFSVPASRVGAGPASGETLAMKPSAAGKTSAMPASSRTSYGAARRTSTLGSGGALNQARAAQRLSNKAAKMGAATGAASTASQPFDQGAGAGGISGSGIAPGGAGVGGQGVNAGPKVNPNNNIKETPPPPTPEGENKTPWQGLTYGAIGSLLLGMLLLMLAQSKAKAGKEAMKTALAMPAADPASAAAKAAAIAAATATLNMAKMMAGGAAALGALAAGLGAMIMKDHGQQNQGMMFLAAGGLMAVMALKVLFDDAAADKVQSGTAEQQELLGKTVDANLDPETKLTALGNNAQNQPQWAVTGQKDLPVNMKDTFAGENYALDVSGKDGIITYTGK